MTSGCHQISSHAFGVYFFRYKDDDIIDEASITQLTITEAREVDGGVYKCRATSDAGKTFSRTAKVTVRGVPSESMCDPLVELAKSTLVFFWGGLVFVFEPL